MVCALDEFMPVIIAREGLHPWDERGGKEAERGGQEAILHPAGLRWARQNVGQLEEMKHADGSRERFQHDAEGRLLEQRGFDGGATKYHYDRNTAGSWVWSREKRRIVWILMWRGGL
jgi:YD repeat-containing protein